MRIEENVSSSRPQVFYKKGFPRNFAKLAGKHLCQGLFFNKVAGPQISKNTFLREHIRCCFFTGAFCEFDEIPKNTFS